MELEVWNNKEKKSIKQYWRWTIRLKVHGLITQLCFNVWNINKATMSIFNKKNGLHIYYSNISVLATNTGIYIQHNGLLYCLLVKWIIMVQAR